MKKNIWAIIGAIAFVIDVCLCFFWNFPGDTIVEIAVGAFSLTSLIVNSIKNEKGKGTFTWKTVVIYIFALVSGGLICIGGTEQSIFLELCGAVLAVLGLIFGLNSQKK